MKEYRHLKFSLDPSFFKIHSTPVIENEFIASLLHECSKLYNAINAIKSSNLSSHGQFTQKDKEECCRDETYKLFQDMDAVSIDELSDKFKSAGMVDQKKINFILQLLLQTRVGIFFKLNGILAKIIIKFTKNSEIPIGICSQTHKRTTSFNYNRFSQSVTLTFQEDINFGYSDMKIGNVYCQITIDSQLNVNLVSVYGVINSYNELTSFYTNNELKGLKTEISRLYQGFLEQAQPSKFSPLSSPNVVVEEPINIAPTAPETSLSPIKLFLNFLSNLFTCFGFQKNKVHKRHKSSSLQINPTLPNHQHKNHTTESSTTELLSFANDPSLKSTDEFIILPTGTIKYELRIETVYQKAKTTAPKKNPYFLSPTANSKHKANGAFTEYSPLIEEMKI